MSSSSKGAASFFFEFQKKVGRLVELKKLAHLRLAFTKWSQDTVSSRVLTQNDLNSASVGSHQSVQSLGKLARLLEELGSKYSDEDVSQIQEACVSAVQQMQKSYATPNRRSLQKSGENNPQVVALLQHREQLELEIVSLNRQVNFARDSKKREVDRLQDTINKLNKHLHDMKRVLNQANEQRERYYQELIEKEQVLEVALVHLATAQQELRSYAVHQDPSHTHSYSPSRRKYGFDDDEEGSKHAKYTAQQITRLYGQVNSLRAEYHREASARVQESVQHTQEMQAAQSKIRRLQGLLDEKELIVQQEKDALPYATPRSTSSHHPASSSKSDGPVRSIRSLKLNWERDAGSHSNSNSRSGTPNKSRRLTSSNRSSAPLVYSQATSPLRRNRVESDSDRPNTYVTSEEEGVARAVEVESEAEEDVVNVQNTLGTPHSPNLPPFPAARQSPPQNIAQSQPTLSATPKRTGGSEVDGDVGHIAFVKPPPPHNTPSTVLRESYTMPSIPPKPKDFIEIRGEGAETGQGHASALVRMYNTLVSEYNTLTHFYAAREDELQSIRGEYRGEIRGGVEEELKLKNEIKSLKSQVFALEMKNEHLTNLVQENGVNKSINLDKDEGRRIIQTSAEAPKLTTAGVMGLDGGVEKALGGRWGEGWGDSLESVVKALDESVQRSHYGDWHLTQLSLQKLLGILKRTDKETDEKLSSLDSIKLSLLQKELEVQNLEIWKSRYESEQRAENEDRRIGVGKGVELSEVEYLEEKLRRTQQEVQELRNLQKIEWSNQQNDRVDRNSRLHHHAAAAAENDMYDSPAASDAGGAEGGDYVSTLRSKLTHLQQTLEGENAGSPIPSPHTVLPPLPLHSSARKSTDSRAATTYVGVGDHGREGGRPVNASHVHNTGLQDNYRGHEATHHGTGRSDGDASVSDAVLLQQLQHLTALNAQQQENIAALALRSQALEEQLASMPPSLSVCVAEKRVVEMKMNKAVEAYEHNLQSLQNHAAQQLQALNNFLDMERLEKDSLAGKVKEQGATIHQLTHHLKILQTQLQTSMNATKSQTAASYYASSSPFTQTHSANLYGSSANILASNNLANPTFPAPLSSSSSYPQPVYTSHHLPTSTPSRASYTTHYSPYPHPLPPELTTSMIGGRAGAEVDVPLPPWDVSVLPRPTPAK
eukprot:gene29991-36225_t